LKHLKIKQNYGLKVTPIYFNKLLFGGDFASETALKMRRKPRFYSLMKQEIQHPILVWYNLCFKELEIFNGGLRVMVAVAKGYDSIDGIIKSNSGVKVNDKDFILLQKLKNMQQQDAKNYFKLEDLESVEKN
tara:strand:- start:46 stop:441 length:396 start_codon:yes stop_codon:yes gene_type:complete